MPLYISIYSIDEFRMLFSLSKAAFLIGSPLVDFAVVAGSVQDVIFIFDRESGFLIDLAIDLFKGTVIEADFLVALHAL